MRFSYFNGRSRRHIAQALLAYFFVVGSVLIFNPCFADQPSVSCPQCADADQACAGLVKLNCDLPQSMAASHDQASLPDLHILAPFILLAFVLLCARVVVHAHRVSITPSPSAKSPPLYLRFGVLLI